MRLRKPDQPQKPAPKGKPAPRPQPAPRAGTHRRSWLIALGVVLVVAVCGYVGWSLLRPDPLRDAREALDRRDFAKANTLLAERLKSHPDDLDAFLLAARTARREHDFGLAHRLLENYERKNGPKELAALETRLLRAHAGQHDEAESLFASYIDKPEDPDTPWVMEAYLEGKLAALAPRSDVQRDAKAAEAAGAANLHRATDLWLKLRPGRADQAQGHVWRGRIFLFSNDHAKGVAALNEALALDASNVEARFHLAMALAQESPAEAARHLEILRAAQPDSYVIRFGIASTYRILGRLTEARPLLETLLSANPSDVAVLLELGQLALDERKLSEAENLLGRAEQRAPNEPRVHLALARLHQLAGRGAEAEKHRKRAEELEAERQKKRDTTPKL